jgi:cobalt-zinc-cadmium efflux system outer membrane protein
MTPHRIVRACALGLLLAGAGGCIAPDVDPAGDFRKAADIVGERSGWQPAWSAPWADDTTSWDGASPLTVRQAVTVALQNNRQLRVDLEGIASAKTDLAQSGLLPNPVLSASFGRNDIGPVSAFSLVQDLVALWMRPSQTDAAGAALRAQVETVSDHALRLAADVRAAHARVVFGQRATGLMQAQLALIQRAIDVAQARLDAGDGTQLDVNRLREELLSAQADLDTQQLDLQTGRRELLALLGMAEAGAEWQAADETGPALDLTGLTETDAVSRAKRLRLDVQAALSVYEQRRHELTSASRGQIPDVAVGLDYDKDEEGLITRSFELSIEVPIFDTKEVGVAKAESDARAAAADADRVLQEAVKQTRSAFLALQANQHLASFFREQILALARENLDDAQKSYDAGESDLTVILDTQRELSDAQLKLNDLELNVATSAAELEYVVGGKL